ncbi:MAG: hypothetical protein PHE47_05580 [Oscillospiraceae bacterium]|nr:hypothetical protein [Oscillospiraceae bacterium]
MSWKWFEQEGIRVSVPFLCGLILFLLYDRTGLGGQMVLAALSHELGHLLAMVAMGERPQRIVFGSFGIRMEKRPGIRISYGKEIGIYAAGPAVNLLIALLFWKAPAVWQVHLLLGLFNLLPMGVLDGGQLLRCFLQRRVDISRSDFWSRSISFSCGVFLALSAAVVLWKSGYNASLLATTAYLFWLLLAGNREI